MMLFKFMLGNSKIQLVLTRNICSKITYLEIANQRLSKSTKIYRVFENKISRQGELLHEFNFFKIFKLKSRLKLILMVMLYQF